VSHSDRQSGAPTAYAPLTAPRGRVAAVIPAWFPPDASPEEAGRLLRTTLAGSPVCLLPRDVVVVVDGCPSAQDAAERLRDELGDAWGQPFTLLSLPENQGKGGAVLAGVRVLLERADPPEWIATRDADGDHLIDDLPHLFRAGEQVAAENPAVPVCVIGRRARLDAPMGWLRAEFELLLNEVLIEAVAWALARKGEVWDTRYLVSRAPDLQSGYKLFGRQAAELGMAGLDRADAAFPELRLRRTGMELVPFVTLAVAGAVFAEVERKTFYDQPVTSYGRVDLARFYGAKLGWALRECGLSRRIGLVLVDGALARRPLFCDPGGRERALALRELVAELLDQEREQPGPPQAPRFRKLL
jgi:hypothetical protein